MRKITDEDMRTFSSDYPFLAAALPDFMNGDKRIHYDEPLLEKADRKLRDCNYCKKGEKCMETRHNSNSGNNYLIPKNDAGKTPCGLDEEGEIVYTDCAKWRIYERWTDLKNLGIPPIFHNCTFNNFTPPNENARKALAACRLFVDDLLAGNETKGIFMSGPFGTGKTHLAAASIIALHDGKVNGKKFAVVPKLLALTRKAINSDNPKDYISEAAAASVLVLDDVGAEKISEWVREQLFLLINERYENQLPTIITTNASMAELEDRIGGASVSRIWGMCRGFVMDGPDHRKKRDGKEVQ